MQRLAYTIPDAASTLGIGRTSIYSLLGSGQLDGRKIGNRTVITAASIEALLANAPRADIRGTS